MKPARSSATVSRAASRACPPEHRSRIWPAHLTALHGEGASVVNHGYLVLHGADPPRLLAPGRHWIGRAPCCALCFDAPGLSRVHACIEVLPGRGVVIRDLGSTNGTWVDGERILMVALDGAARVRVGELELILRPATGEQGSGLVPAPGPGASSGTG